MKVEKQFAALVLCLVVLWASRFGPHSCEARAAFPVGAGPSWQTLIAAGGLLLITLFVPAYDFIAFMTYRLGLDRSFDHLEIYPGDPPPPNAANVPEDQVASVLPA
jgi:hypothetical protein